MAASIISGARRLTVSELKDNAARAATGFASLGVAAGDCVALLLRNDFAFIEASEACGLLGAYTVLINWHFTVDEARYILSDSGAKVLVTHADLVETARAAAGPGVFIIAVEAPPEIVEAFSIVNSSLPSAVASWQSWRDSFEPYAGPPVAAPGPIYYTSGTTGRPKGVKRLVKEPAQMQALLRLTSRMFGMEDAIFSASGERIVTVISGPMYHGGPNAAARLALVAGATVILMPRFDAETLLALIERERVTHLYMVPTMFVRLLRLPADVRRSYDLSSLRWVIHTAAPCPQHVKRDMIEWWGPIINEYYAATETCPSAFISSSDWLKKPGSVGRAPAGVTLKVVMEDQSEADVGEVGEIFVGAEAVPDFTYHNDPEKRAAAGHQGLVSVGDIGFLDIDGYLYLCDRKSQMVISGGVNIYPAEIEAELLKMPGVADAAVFGIPDEEFGESLAAHIELESGAQISSGEVREFLGGVLARYKVPRVLVFEEALPREDSGKIFKRKLRDQYWQDAGRRI